MYYGVLWHAMVCYDVLCCIVVCLSTLKNFNQVVKHLFDRVRAISEIHNCHAEYWRGLKYALYMVIDTVCGLGAVFVE